MRLAAEAIADGDTPLELAHTVLRDVRDGLNWPHP